VALEARERGAIVRPLGDVVVLMPPLTIPMADLQRLVEIVADSIRAASHKTCGQAEKPAALDSAAAAPEQAPDEVPRAA
jgi:hypothetical protein